MSIMGTVYPVGSLYFGTQSTCPLQSLGIGTWKKVGTSLTLSVNTSVPVKGNGKTIGLTDGANNYGLQGGFGGGEFLSAAAGNYGKDINTPNVTPRYIGNKTLGLTTDSAASGIVGTVTRTALTVNIWKRTA